MNCESYPFCKVAHLGKTSLHKTSTSSDSDKDRACSLIASPYCNGETTSKVLSSSGFMYSFAFCIIELLELVLMSLPKLIANVNLFLFLFGRNSTL